MLVRAARWPEDAEAIAAVDTSFSSDRVYRVDAHEVGFRLREERVSPPVHKAYAVQPLAGRDGFVAEDDGAVIGFAEVELGTWNGRATIGHLYVDRARRGRGAGAALVEALAERALATGARCLWLETQNVNHPAISFYRRVGFRLCGLDDTLYDPAESPGEVALFFSRDLQ